jgi:hypothetical protein
MAQWKQGQSGNPAGRPKGIRSKSTEQLRKILAKFLTANLTSIQQEYDSLKTAREKLNFVERLLRHVLPPPQDELMRLSDADLDRLINKLKNNRL